MNPSRRSPWALAVLVAPVVLAACGIDQAEESPAVTAAQAGSAKVPSSSCAPVEPGEVALPGGAFLMGATPEHPEEGPPKPVTVGPFSIDLTEVTVEQFAEFVAATGYVTASERAPDPKLYPGVPTELLVPSSLVFVGAEAGASLEDPSGWWRIVPGASWRKPYGPQSDVKDPARVPVVQVSYQDALAYARWKGRDLPTEAEWEYAARGGLQGASFVWGDEKSPAGAPRANTWQGVFPVLDAGVDGYKARVAPVGCYPPNGFGLHDMAGNVWEWTSTPYARDVGHTIKGGSFLCADNYCFRYRPSARQEGPPDTGSSHVGFRTVKRAS